LLVSFAIVPAAANAVSIICRGVGYLEGEGQEVVLRRRRCRSFIVAKGQSDTTNPNRIVTRHHGERSQAYRLSTLTSLTVLEPLSVDLVDILPLVPCFDDCSVEAVKKFLQGLLRLACKHRERAAVTPQRTGPILPIVTSPPDFTRASIFLKRVGLFFLSMSQEQSQHVTGNCMASRKIRYGVVAS
jgi:hypothetical protein